MLYKQIFVMLDMNVLGAHKSLLKMLPVFGVRFFSFQIREALATGGRTNAHARTPGSFQRQRKLLVHRFIVILNVVPVVVCRMAHATTNPLLPTIAIVRKIMEEKIATQNIMAIPRLAGVTLEKEVLIKSTIIMFLSLTWDLCSAAIAIISKTPLMNHFL